MSVERTDAIFLELDQLWTRVKPRDLASPCDQSYLLLFINSMTGWLDRQVNLLVSWKTSWSLETRIPKQRIQKSGNQRSVGVHFTSLHHLVSSLKYTEAINIGDEETMVSYLTCEIYPFSQMDMCLSIQHYCGYDQCWIKYLKATLKYRYLARKRLW